MDRALPHVCPPPPLPGPQLPGTRNFQKAEHPMEKAFIEHPLTPGISEDDRMKTIMILVLAERTV